MSEDWIAELADERITNNWLERDRLLYDWAQELTQFGRAVAERVRRETLEDQAQREQALREALVEAIDKWENAAIYKGADLIKKHGDAEDIARLRALAGDALPAAQEQAGRVDAHE